MKIDLVLSTLALLGVLGLSACGGTQGSVTVSGTDLASVRNAPAGTSIFVFVDLETLRPDQLLSGGSSLPTGITVASAGGVSTYTFNTTAANGGALTGTITVTGAVPPTGTPAAFTEVFNLASTTTLPGHATQTWTYTGSQQITVTGTSARIALADPSAPIQAAFADSATPGHNKSYGFTPTIIADLGSPPSVALSGGYGLSGSNGDVITCSFIPGSPFVWVPGACPYPTSGSLSLSLVSPSGNDQTTASFQSGCGNLDLGGATLNLGS